MLRLYGITIFLSASLLFLVQPMFVKMVLPLLGGTPAVWTTAMVFFQAVLLAGYAYADATSRWLGPRRQAVLHLVVLVAALWFLPFAVPTGWEPPAEGNPAAWLLLVLCVGVGGPLFVVCSSTPLLQKWFTATGHPAASDPYFLYSASNTGSLLALAGYPLLVEPQMRLAVQSLFWSCGYAVLVLLTLGCAVLLWRNPGARTASPPKKRRRTRREDQPAARLGPVTLGRRLRWVGLSLAPSSWMLSVTTYLTTDLAPVPLLWVVPLATYLLTFILVFARRPLIPHAWMVRLFPVAVLLLVVAQIFQGVWQMLLFHLVVFFIGAMVCHGELAEDRPDPAHLTEFYLWLAVGGFLGGLLNAIVAPLVFNSVLEYPLTVMLACALVPAFRREEKGETSHRVDLGLLALCALVVATFTRTLEFIGTTTLVVLVLSGVPVLIGLALWNRTRWFAVVAGLLLVAGQIEPPIAGRVLFARRSFFGVHRVVADPKNEFYRMMHGTTLHGSQGRAGPQRCEPLVYFSRGGPLGQVFAALEAKGDAKRVAVIGLGAGSVASYGQEGGHMTFYEIDPVVKQIAEAPELFTYLSECCQGEYSIVLGDGRRQIARAANGSYDVIVLDAFSSDAIPIHLLTREALAIYLEKLSDEGLLAFHITNTHLDLAPVLANLAADAGLVAVVCRDWQLTEERREADIAPSTYVVLARHRRDLAGLEQDPLWHELRPQPQHRLWTDDYSNLVEVLKWW